MANDTAPVASPRGEDDLPSAISFTHPINKKGLFSILILQGIIFSLALLLPIKATIAIIIGVGGIIFIFLNKRPLIASLILSLFVALILPYPTGRKFLFKLEELFPLITLFFLILDSFEGKLKKEPIGGMGKCLLGFLTVVIISAFIGLTKGRAKILIFDELMMLSLWGIYFIVLKIGPSEKEMKEILLTIIITSLIISLYYIYEFYSLGGAERFRTDQQHIFNFTIPLLFALFLYEKRKRWRILTFLLMIPMIIAVYVTLTRALWLLVPLALFSQYLYFIRTGAGEKRLYSYIFPILIIIIIGLFGLMLLNTFFGVERLLGGRFASLKILEYDVSLLARMELGRYVIEKVEQSPFLGVGLADFVRYRYFPTLGRFNVYLLDNTYLQLLWKTGILGSILFLGMMVFLLLRAWFILRNGLTDFDKIIGSSIFFSFFTLMISGLQCSILVGYRFNLVWAILAGITEIRAREIKLCRKLSKQSGKD